MTSLQHVNQQPPEKVVHDADPTLLDVVDVWYTIQGEGPLAGVPAVFVRLAGCTILCRGCDTDYTTGRHPVSVADLLRAIGEATPAPYVWPVIGSYKPVVVLTGGEPFRQPIGLLARTLMENGYRVQVETNGSVFLEEFPYLGDVLIVCSPKLPNVHPYLRRYVAALKYVLSADAVDVDDGLPLTTLDTPRGVCRPWSGFQGEVYVQPMDVGDPEGNDKNTKAAVLSCMRYGYRLAVQTHKICGLA